MLVSYIYILWQNSGIKDESVQQPGVNSLLKLEYFITIIKHKYFPLCLQNKWDSQVLSGLDNWSNLWLGNMPLGRTCLDDLCHTCLFYPHLERSKTRSHNVAFRIQPNIQIFLNLSHGNTQIVWFSYILCSFS